MTSFDFPYFLFIKMFNVLVNSPHRNKGVNYPSLLSTSLQKKFLFLHKTCQPKLQHKVVEMSSLFNCGTRVSIPSKFISLLCNLYQSNSSWNILHYFSHLIMFSHTKHHKFIFLHFLNESMMREILRKKRLGIHLCVKRFFRDSYI